MPDRVHFFFSPVDSTRLAGRILSESYEQKWSYVRENPVRAGLVAVADDWSWQGEVERLHLGSL